MKNKFLERIKNLSDEELKVLSDADAENISKSSEWEGIPLNLERLKEETYRKFKEWQND